MPMMGGHSRSNSFGSTSQTLSTAAHTNTLAPALLETWRAACPECESVTIELNQPNSVYSTKNSTHGRCHNCNAKFDHVLDRKTGEEVPIRGDA